MTSITLKRKISSRIEEIDDVTLLKSLYSFLNSDFIRSKENSATPGVPMTASLFRERILAASKRAKTAKVISQTDVEKIASNW